MLMQNVTTAYFILNGFIAFYELFMFYSGKKKAPVDPPVFINRLGHAAKTFLIVMYHFLVNLIFGTVFLIGKTQKRTKIS